MIPPPLLEAKNVSRSFGGVRALSGVNLTVQPNAIQAVIGPNGAGKTTFFNVVSGVLAPDTGEIHFENKPITHMKPHQVAQRGISRTFQNVSLFPTLTVLENVMLGCHGHTRAGLLSCALHLRQQRREEREIREHAHECLAVVGLEAAARLSVGELPFGQRRMLEMARALATKPKLLLLDEPASGLNTGETAKLAEMIHRIRKRGVTILLVEHDMSLVMEVSEQILVLNFGVPIAEGDPVTVRNLPEVISVYLGGAFQDAAH